MFILLAFLFPILSTTLTLFLLASVGLIVYFYRYVKKRQSFWEAKGVKYLKPQFLTGNFDILQRKSFSEITQELYHHFPDERYHGFYQFLQPVLMIKDPNLIKTITVKEFDHFVDHRAFVNAETDTLWSKNLVASKGERWRDLRTTLSPSFTSSKMKIMYNLIDECALQFVEYFKNDASEVIELEMKDTLRRYTNDVIATTAFGVKCNSLQDRNNSFYQMGVDASSGFGGWKLLKLFVFAMSPTLSRVLRIKFISSHVAKYFSKIIEDTLRIREEKNIVRPDMIHLLMEAQKGRQHQDEDLKVNEGFSSVEETELFNKIRRKQEITKDDIVSQAFVFFFAGFDTVSTLLSFAFYELAINPEIQSKLRQEIEEVEELTYESLLSLKYLDNVISESLRKWPPAVITDRIVTKAYTIQPERPGEKPLQLEEGLFCMLPIFSLHRDPKFYPEPEKFDPDRFNDENKHKINTSVYMPFGAGPRNCIGSRFALLESKLIIFHVLKNFEVVTTAKTPIPLVLDSKQGNPTAKGGMWVGLKKIH